MAKATAMAARQLPAMAAGHGHSTQRTGKGIILSVFGISCGYHRKRARPQHHNKNTYVLVLALGRGCWRWPQVPAMTTGAGHAQGRGHGLPPAAGHGCWPRPAYSENGHRDLHVSFGYLARVPKEAHETITINCKPKTCPVWDHGRGGRQWPWVPLKAADGTTRVTYADIHAGAGLQDTCGHGHGCGSGWAAGHACWPWPWLSAKGPAAATQYATQCIFQKKLRAT